MERNKLLTIALAVSNIFRILLIAFIVLLTFVLVHWHFDPEAYSAVKLSGFEHSNTSNLYTSSFTMTSTTTTGVASKGGDQDMYLQQISRLSLYLFYLQTAAILTVWMLILQQIIQLIKSVRELQTFRNSNSATLRKIGRYCFLIFILTAFRWAETETGSFIGVYVNYLPILFMLGAFILAEIFEEGNKLYEAEQLTI